MYFESRFFTLINEFLSFLQKKLAFLGEKSYILSNIEHILFLFICLAIILSLVCGNGITALLICFVIGFFLLTLMLKKGAHIFLEKSTFFLLMYFIVALVSTVNSTMMSQSFVGLSKTALYLAFYLSVLQYLRLHKEKIYTVVSVIAYTVCFEAVVAVLQNNANVLSAATWQDTRTLNPELVLTRVYGTLKPSNPNLLGGFLIAASPFLWLDTVLNFFDRKHISFVFDLIFSLVSVSAIFMTGCRGAYIALFFMFIGFLVFAFNIIKTYYPEVFNSLIQKKNMIISVCFAGVAGVLVCFPKIFHRILSIFAMRNDSSTSFRMNVYASSFEMFRDNFWLGIGSGNKVFREIYGLYMLSGFDALSAYSVFLETAVESGIFGLIFYLLFVIFLIKYAVKAYINVNDIKIKTVIGIMLLSIFGVLIHGFFDTIYFRPQVQLIFWTTAAILTVCSDYKEINGSKV